MSDVPSASLADPPERPDEIVRSSGLDHLLAQRDKHLAQFMEINAKGTFAVLAVIFSVLVGLDKVKGLLAGFPCVWILYLGGLAAVGSLGYAAAKISSFHTGKIRHIQQRILRGQQETRRSDYEIIPPPGRAFVFVFIGMMIFAIGAVSALVLAMTSRPVEKQVPAAHQNVFVSDGASAVLNAPTPPPAELRDAASSAAAK